MSDVTLTIDGLQVTVPAGTSVFDAARLNGIDIPTLCHQQNEVPVGVCRVCVVEIERNRVLQASCVRPAENGMVVHTNSDLVKGPRHTLLEMLMADHPSPCNRQQHSGDCELEVLAKAEGISAPRFPHRISRRGQDDTSPVIFVDHEACILCDRCIRGCDETKSFLVLGRRGKGFEAGVAFDLDTPMGNSDCRSCGECMTCCPTGALTNKAVVETVLPKGEAVDVETLLNLPYFEDVSGTFLELNKKAVVVRRFKPGDIICREGEYGSTAFYILEGTADVFLESDIGHVKSSGGSSGFLSKLASRLSKRTQDVREEESNRRSIPIDASVDLPYDNPVAQLHPGDLFGEMTCMSLYPRSATVRAASECVMLEMLRNVLDIMMRDKNLKARLEDNYKKRALEDHLRSVPMFASLTSEFIDTLRDSVQLIRYNKGEVIVRQNDLADAFYLIRIGFVKVTEEYTGGDLVLAYLGRGGYFGEMGLLGEGRRTATCTAMDHVEVVRIDDGDFHRMMQEFPDVRRQLEHVAQEHQQQNRERLATSTHVPLSTFLERGLMEAQSLLVLDLEKCTRCDQCTRACADAHDGVTRLIREGLRFENFLVATSCRQCRDPLCMVGCPVGSIRRRNSLEVIIEDWCTGCGLCARNCPYGNISMHEFPEQGGRKAKKKATSCDLCTEHAEPTCVYACPHDAAHRVEPNAFFKHVIGQAANFGNVENRK